MEITRAQVQDLFRSFVADQTIPQTKDSFKHNLETWLSDQNADELTTNQILNDLESYQEYFNLLN